MSERVPRVEHLLFGGHLRQLRRSRDWTLAALARRSGMSVATISGIERGARGASLDSILVLARALEIHPARLFAYIPREES